MYCLPQWLLVGLLSVITLMFFQLVYFRLSENNDDLNSDHADEFDFIIVGGGTAGSVLARRLAEDGRHTVMLLEAGTNILPWWASIPFLVPLLQQQPWDWKFLTEPQVHSSWALRQQQSLWPRGELLGGSSQMNYMIHLRGTPEDYARWQEATNCEGWSFRHLLPYFIMSEALETSKVTSKGMRGRHGPLRISSGDEQCRTSKVCQGFLKSLEGRQYLVNDIGEGLENGAMPIQCNIDGGRRFSVIDSYLQPVLQARMANLHIITNALATKVLIHPGPPVKVEGISFTRKRGEAMKQKKARARREVILSAGTVGSPHLLLLSGIGPREELNKHSIRPIIDLPVGKNLQDHLTLPIYFHSKEGTSLSLKSIIHPSVLWDYLWHGKGPLAGTGVEAIARITLPCHNYTFLNHQIKNVTQHVLCSPSNFLLALFAVGSIQSEMYINITNADQETFKYLFPAMGEANKKGFFILLTLARVASRGMIRLRNTDPRAAPLIQPQYLHDEADVQHFIKGIRFIASLVLEPSMKELEAEMYLPDLPHCRRHNRSVSDDAYLECWTRTATITSHHPTGTCPMGRTGDIINSVTDANLSVQGVSGLRVVDASVFPQQIATYPHATVIAVAEKAAQLILETRP